MATNVNTQPILSGGETGVYAVAFGTKDGTQQWLRAPIRATSDLTAVNLAVGTTNLTAAMCNVDLILATAAGSTSLMIPTFADLGFPAWDANNPKPKRFTVWRVGVGLLSVGGATGVTVDHSHMDPSTILDPADSLPTTYVTVGQNLWKAA